MRTFIIAEALELEASDGSELVVFVFLGLGYKFHLSAKLMVSFSFTAG